MNDSSPDRAAVLAFAEREVLSGGLKILDRRWHSGDLELDLVAAARGSVLVAVEVIVGEPGDTYRDFADVSDERIRQLRVAAVAWMGDHGARYEQVRVDVAGLSPNESGGFTAEYIEGVG